MYVLQFLNSEDTLHSAWAKKIITWMKKKKKKEDKPQDLLCQYDTFFSWWSLLHIRNKDFGKQGMEADAFKEEEHMSQQTANDLASMAPSSNIITEKVMPSLSPGRVDNTSESSSRQCPLLYSSEASSMMGNSNVSRDNLGHNQGFQHARQLYYLASSDFFPQKLAPSETQAGIHDASDTLEMLTPPLLPASEPGLNHCAPTYKNMEQVSLL